MHSHSANARDPSHMPQVPTSRPIITTALQGIIQALTAFQRKDYTNIIIINHNIIHLFNLLPIQTFINSLPHLLDQSLAHSLTNFFVCLVDMI